MSWETARSRKLPSQSLEDTLHRHKRPVNQKAVGCGKDEKTESQRHSLTGVHDPRPSLW